MAEVYKGIEERIKQRDDWARRRQLGVPNNKLLWVLTCMDERIPVNEALGIEDGDAHIFRNAGGLVTDDAIRSAMLTTQFFGTKEIVVLGHTECGMMSAKGDDLTELLKQRGIDVDRAEIDPGLPGLELPKGRFTDWIRMFESVDQSVKEQVDKLRNSPLIPKDVTIHGYVYEVETGRVRKPGDILATRVHTRAAMAGETSEPELAEA
jgi:carbonic anhydrase